MKPNKKKKNQPAVTEIWENRINIRLQCGLVGQFYVICKNNTTTCLFKK